MDRRGLLGSFAIFGGLFAARPARAASAATPDRAKVVYHLNERDRVQFVLGNIENHFEGMGGPDNVTIALVVHGPALKAFHAASASPDIRARLAVFVRSGVTLGACANTMKSQSVFEADLLPGFVRLERGGVVRIAELQSQGYVYLRP